MQKTGASGHTGRERRSKEISSVVSCGSAEGASAHCSIWDSHAIGLHKRSPAAKAATKCRFCNLQSPWGSWSCEICRNEYIISFLRSGQGIFAVPCVPISKHSRHMEVTGRWDAGSSLHPSTYLVTLANITLLASSAATSPSATLIANCNVGASRYLPIRGSIPASQTIPSPGLYNGQHAGLWWDWECLAQADFSWSPTSNICLYQVGNSG